jgi:hypothetical protein
MSALYKRTECRTHYGAVVRASQTNLYRYSPLVGLEKLDAEILHFCYCPIVDAPMEREDLQKVRYAPEVGL